MTRPLLRFYVVERDTFIAQDMRAGLLEACPDCDVECLRKAEDLGARLDAITDTHTPVLVTSMTLAALQETGLAARVMARGGRIVLRQGGTASADVQALGWFALPSPFTTAHLADLVDALMSDMETADPKAGRSDVTFGEDAQEY